MSKSRRCLSEDPERTYGGLKSIEAMLESFNVQVVGAYSTRMRYVMLTREYGGSRMSAEVPRSLHPKA
jgi:hypothetical protein